MRVATGAATAVPAEKATTRTPVVFFGLSDPVKVGVVRSLARRGGNVTGLTYSPSYDYWGKLLDLLKTAVPSLQRVGLLRDLPDDRPVWWETLQRAGTSLGVRGDSFVTVRGPDTFPGAIMKLRDQRVDGVIVTTGSTTYVHRRPHAEGLLRAGLPSIGLLRELPEDGGFLSYGINVRV